MNQFEPVHEKTNNLVFQPGQTQTRLYSHRRKLDSGNFGYKKKRNCTIRVAKTKALISLAVTAKLVCVFVFPYANCWFSHVAAHFNFERSVHFHDVSSACIVILHILSVAGAIMVQFITSY